jgi:hypothetical protein
MRLGEKFFWRLRSRQKKIALSGRPQIDYPVALRTP